MKKLITIILLNVICHSIYLGQINQRHKEKTINNLNVSFRPLNSSLIQRSGNGHSFLPSVFGCTLINYPVPTAWSLVNYYTGATLGSDGWINGVNIYNDKEKAMYFDASSSPYTKMTRVYINFGRAYSSNPNKIVPVKIYDGTSGNPGGTLLGTANLTMGQIMADRAGNFYTEAVFANPINLPASKKFFVSVDLSNLCWSCSPKDTLSIVSNSNGQTLPGRVWEKQSNNIWYNENDLVNSWGIDISLVMHPALTDDPVIATFTTSTNTACAGSPVIFNASGSTFQDTLIWEFPSGNPGISNNPVQSTVFNNPGTYTVKLYVIGGGCSELDSAETIITVNPTPTMNISASANAICSGNSVTLSASGSPTFTWLGNVQNGIAFSPTSTATYTVVGSNTFNCTDTATQTINVNALPIVNLGNDTTLCGSSILLNAGNPSSSYIWNNGTTQQTNLATSTGIYVVQVTNSNNCQSIDTISVTLNPIPQISLSFSTNDTICLNNGIVSVITSPSGGNVSGPGVSGSNFDPQVAGSGSHPITYSYTDNNNCSSTQTNNLVVLSCISIAETVEFSKSLTVFPNPGNGQFTLNGIEEGSSINILNCLGQSVYEVKSKNKTLAINLENITKGFYIIRETTLNGEIAQIQYLVN